DGRIGVAQGDVSGHGVQAGLVMSMTKKVLAIYARQGGEPAEVLAAVNDAIAEDLGGKMFVTVTYAILDPSARTITTARAGHNPTIRFNTHTGELEEIAPPGMIVGMKAGPLFSKVIKSTVTEVRSGDIFIIYTDGVTETRNRQGEEYETDRLNELIRRHAGTVEPQQLIDRIVDSLRGFRGGLPADDDVTILAMAVD
ncbi:MAG: PP2C family protein-serine/threonine phosphatase, partial [Planctomycetota bacterium]